MKYREINDYDVRYVENNPYYYNCIDIINQLFPEVKIIWVIRHPKTFISSHIRWERQRLKSRIANYLIPFWQPITYIDQLRGIHNNYYQRVDVYSKIWAIKNKEILKSLQNKNNYICLKYENIFNPVTGIDILENLLEWLELSASKIISTDLFSNRVNSSNPIKNIWNEQCNNLMKMHCNELMQQFGYQ